MNPNHSKNHDHGYPRYDNALRTLENVTHVDVDYIQIFRSDA